MLKVRTRRSCPHGGGISSKSTVKSKGSKKLVLSSGVKDGTLITSSSRKRKAESTSEARAVKRGVAAKKSASSPNAQTCGVASNAGQGCALPVNERRSPEHLSADSSVTEDDTIFSPAFHQIKTSPNTTVTELDACLGSASTLVASGSAPAPSEECLNTAHFSPLARCVSLTNAAVAPEDLSRPEADCGNDDLDIDAHTGDDSDLSDFDPYLFIKRLPQLSEVVPQFRPHLLPKQTRRTATKTLVLDLDETLVHSTMDICSEADFTFPVDFNNHLHTVYVRMRPHLQEFLDRVSQLFEVIVFTASQSVYAEKLLNILDPKRNRVQHRVFRESCVFVDGNYLKDLTVLGRELSQVAIVDNSPQAFGFQVDNGIPIESWFDDKEDRALVDLLPFLESLVHEDDVRPAIAARFKLRARVENACIHVKRAA